MLKAKPPKSNRANNSYVKENQMKLFENQNIVSGMEGSGLRALDNVMQQICQNGQHFSIDKAIDESMRQLHELDSKLMSAWSSPFSGEQSKVILELTNQFILQALINRSTTRMKWFKLVEGKIEKATRGSAAFDLFATEDVLVGDEAVAVKTGVKTEFHPGLVAIIKEKSGLALKGVEVKAGVIDSDYRDEWKVLLRFPQKLNWKCAPIEHIEQTINIQKGMKIAQAILFELPTIELMGEGITIKDEVREGGFGSTGK